MVGQTFDDALFDPRPERYEPLPVDEMGEYDSVSEGEWDEDVEAVIAAWELSRPVVAFDPSEAPF